MGFPISITSSGHEFEKQNLVTIHSKRGGYDKMKCSKCGLEGKRYNFEEVQIYGRVDKTKANSCPNRAEFIAPSKVRVIRCTAQGEEFSGLIPDSVHEIVTPPKPYKNDHTGVWVMGKTEPVKLLSNEFEKIK